MSALGRKISITGTPPNCTVEIDGTPTEIMSLDLHLDGNSLPSVVITPPVFEVDVYLEGKVELDEKTKSTLKALGWTPPEDMLTYRDVQPADVDIEKWIRINPQAFEAWVRKWNRINGR